MATNPQAQHRCVFVGNIPYDATEEQLVQICEEVGPVVSFRLVIDRETGKPKGYGFCEYKDEETALSARRNLQGYEINGRQLRVDFAENDKNADRNREQGLGGPGVVPNADAPKNFGGPVVPGNPSLHQPIGDSVAMAAATVMARALGSAQIATTPNQTVSQTQTMLGTDPLTRHLAKMSSSQLTEVVSELKAMATQNKEQARQLLLALPNLPKAIFQAEIMLGMVTPQMLQMPNIRQASTQPMQPLVQSAQTLPGLPPLPQNRMQSGLPPYAPESRVSAGIPNQYTSVQQFPTQSHIQRPQLLQNQVLQQGKMLGQSGGSSFPSVLPQSLGGVSVPQHVHMPTSSSFNQQMQHPLSQNLHSLTSSAMAETLNLKGHNLGAPRKTSIISDTMNQMDRASKMMKLNDGRASPSSQPVSMAKTLSAPIPTSRVEETPNTERQATQLQLPADVDSTLLQQVLSLTPQQLSSLSADQQQQVLQLQQMLRHAT